MGRLQPYLHNSGDTFAIYRIHQRPPITVEWKSCIQNLRIGINEHPPYVALYFDSPGLGAGMLYALQSVEHGEINLREGFKVTAPSVLDTFCARLVQEGRASVLAWRHCEVCWNVLRFADAAGMDAYWGWRKWAPDATRFDLHGRPVSVPTLK